MAAHTDANFTQYYSNERPLGTIQGNFISGAPIFLALCNGGIPRVVSRGYLKQRWTSGSLASKVNIDTGTYSGTLMSGDYKRTLEWSFYGVPIKVNRNTAIAGATEEEQFADQLANAEQAQYIQVIAGLVAADDGTDNTLQGATGVLGLAMPITAGMTIHASGSYSSSQGLLAVNAAVAQMGDINGSRMVLVTSLDGLAYLHNQMVTAGYGPTTSLISRNFDGRPVLTYNGIEIYGTDKMTSSWIASYGQCTNFLIFKVNDLDGVEMIAPDDNWFIIEGGEHVADSFTRKWDVGLTVQLFVHSPRAIARVFKQKIR